MAYDPLFDAAQKAVDDVLGEGEYARLNKDNPGVPAELRSTFELSMTDPTHRKVESRPECNCPFYGRHLYPANSKIVEPPFLLLDQRGNQCALIVTAFSPCQMEITAQPVDWRACHVVLEVRLRRP